MVGSRCSRKSKPEFLGSGADCGCGSRLYVAHHLFDTQWPGTSVPFLAGASHYKEELHNETSIKIMRSMATKFGKVHAANGERSKYRACDPD